MFDFPNKITHISSSTIQLSSLTFILVYYSYQPCHCDMLRNSCSIWNYNDSRNIHLTVSTAFVSFGRQVETALLDHPFRVIEKIMYYYTIQLNGYAHVIISRICFSLYAWPNPSVQLTYDERMLCASYFTRKRKKMDRKFVINDFLSDTYIEHLVFGSNKRLFFVCVVRHDIYWYYSGSTTYSAKAWMELVKFENLFIFCCCWHKW